MKMNLEFDRWPSVAAYHLRGLLPSPGLVEGGGFPPIRAALRHHRIRPQHLSGFLAVTGLSLEDGVPLLYPHVLGFRLQMVILTHPAFPVPIWKILQTRNHLLQHRPIRPDAVLDLESRVASQRILEKGVEVDLLSSVRSGGELLWESLNTFYCRGRFGQAEAASSLAVSPQVPGPIQAEWNGTPGYGWRFAALTGDFNGIHTCGWYARLFGFRGAFHHPQIVLGHAMARLPEIRATGAQQLDVWLKGPVYYDARIRLRTTPGTGASDFAVHTGEDERPAIIGRWTRNPAPSPWGVPVGSRPGSVSS